MSNIFNEPDYPEQDPIQGFGLTVSEMRIVARRQFVGSVVAGSLVVAIAALIGFRSHSSMLVVTAHKSVEQPVFVAPPDHVIAEFKLKREAQ